MGNFISNHNCLECFDKIGGCIYCKVNTVSQYEPAVLEKAEVGTEPDMVNHPKHYQLSVGDQYVEVLDLIEAVLCREEFIGYLRGNMMKYDMRAGSKGNREQDLQKSHFYSKVLHRVLMRQIPLSHIPKDAQG